MVERIDAALNALCGQQPTPSILVGRGRRELAIAAADAALSAPEAPGDTLRKTLEPFSHTFEPNRQWQHQKSGGFYRLVAQGRIEDSLDHVIIYKSEKDGSVWVRPFAEFISRFQLTDTAFITPSAPGDTSAAKALPTQAEIEEMVKRLRKCHAYVVKHEHPDMTPDGLDTITIWTEAASMLEALGKAVAERDDNWTCFHCGETFTDRQSAALHFGADERAEPLCTVDISEEFRNLEAELVRYRAEDSDADRQFHAMRADHAVALRRAEEEGYAKGMRDVAPPGDSKPVAWRYEWLYKDDWIPAAMLDKPPEDEADFRNIVPLYAHPSKG